MTLHRRPWAPFALVALVAVAVHAGSIRGAFLDWDDKWLVGENARVVEGGLSDLGSILDPTADRADYGLEYLPVRDLSYRLDRAFFGLNPAGYHLGNVLLFGVAAAALLGVLRILTGDRRAALLGALIFAVHPVATESVACIAHRKDVLLAAFFLGAWLAWLRDRRLLALLLGAAAMLSKLPAVVLPALLLLGDVSLRRRLDARRLAWLGGLCALALEAVLVGMERAPALGGATWHGGTPWTNLLSAGAAFLEGVRLLLLPVGLQVGRVNEAMTRTAPDAASLGGLALLVGLVAFGTWSLLRRRSSGSIGVVAAIASLGLVAVQLPYLQIRPFWVLFAERYLVLALVPLSLAGGVLLARLPAFGRTTAAVLLVLLAVSTWNRERDWRNTDVLFSNAIAKAPRSYIALEKVSQLRLLEGRYEDAARLARRAIEAAEGYREIGQAHRVEILAKGHVTLVNALLGLSRWAKAEAAIDAYERAEVDPWRPVFFRGLLAHSTERLDEAVRLYGEAIDAAREAGEAPAVAHHNLATIYRAREGPASERAREHLEAAVASDPRMADAWLLLAQVHEAASRWEEAAAAYRRVSELDPENPAWLLRLATILEEKLRRYEEAREVRRRVARLR